MALKKRSYLQLDYIKLHRNTRIGYLFVLPSLLVVIFVLVYPVIQAFLYSLKPEYSENSEWSFENYANLISDDRFVESFNNTLIFTFFTIPAELIFGLVIAVLLNKEFKFRGIVRVAILFPWALPTALNAIMWRWMFNTEFGIINYGLISIGLIENQLNWLGKEPLAMIAMMSVSTWKTSSFMALLLLAGLQTIPKDLYESAKTDGASDLKSFFYITLPLLTPAIIVSLLLRTMDALRVFELPFNFTDGGPLNTTETISLYSYRVLFEFVEFNYGSSMVIVQFILIMIMSLIYIKSIKNIDY
ncbi:MAG: sugar ABC transporter permease [SAR324 cluster bacterium]|nr:sugar ABC transporter permease [SAR324 cluster bacterium]